ncbi:MAG: Threonine synthase [Candidatus Heimdallarchaeota archaeon LC_3]|nr:MAG: Threonine synthase [Candidatus Heimdallarchaeota archaeon LC_3]
MEKARETVTKDTNTRSYDIWRMQEIMPVKDQKYRFSLGEGWTPILPLHRLNEKYGLNLFLKDEGKNPTGTFKSRGICTAVSKAIELGVKEFVIPTTGNAGAALSAYTARSGTKAHVFMPNDSSTLIKNEVKAMGGDLTLVDGLISDAGKFAKENAEKYGWFDVSTLKEPYRVEGKKTMGLELAEQFNWNLENVTIVYPTGGGTGIVGMWKAFEELNKIGLINEQFPRMVSVQVDTCAPIVKAFRENKEYGEFWESASTLASGLLVPTAIGDYLILKAVRESSGTAITVTDNELKSAMFSFAKLEGIMLAPEAAATVAAVNQLKETSFIERHDKVVLFGTGNGLTTPELWNNYK